LTDTQGSFAERWGSFVETTGSLAELYSAASEYVREGKTQFTVVERGLWGGYD